MGVCVCVCVGECLWLCSYACIHVHKWMYVRVCGVFDKATHPLYQLLHIQIFHKHYNGFSIWNAYKAKRLSDLITITSDRLYPPPLSLPEPANSPANYCLLTFHQTASVFIKFLREIVATSWLALTICSTTHGMGTQSKPTRHLAHW